MNSAPAVALPFSSHARLGGAPPRPARPALRLANPDDTPANPDDTPAVHPGTPAVLDGLAAPGDTLTAPGDAQPVPGDTPGRRPVIPPSRRQPRPQTRPASHPQAHPQTAHPQTRPQAAHAQTAHAQTAHPRTEQPPLRLTRRGRIVVAALAALVVSVFCLIAASTAQATNHGAPAGAARGGTAKVTVRPGQSLWSVAESADPNQDTRLVVQQITELNGLTSQVVYSGEQLWVPRG
jgi:hypothetical protein